MIRLYADENFPHPTIILLKKRQYDVLIPEEVGLINQGISDVEILSFSTNQGRALLTLNRKDFIRLHNSTPKHSGIIVCTFDPDFSNQAKQIHNAISSLDFIDNQLIRINRAIFK